MWRLLLDFLPDIIFGAFKYLGIGFVTYQGFDYLIAALFDYVRTSLQGLPSDIAMLLGLAGFDKAISITLSAISAKALISSISTSVSLVRTE